MTNASPRAAVTDLVSFESGVNPLLRSALRCGLLALFIRRATAAGSRTPPPMVQFLKQFSEIRHVVFREHFENE